MSSMFRESEGSQRKDSKRSAAADAAVKTGITLMRMHTEASGSVVSSHRESRDGALILKPKLSEASFEVKVVGTPYQASTVTPTEGI